jgi:hypothetical protein
MYHGEVAIPTEDVTQFLGLAEQFKVGSIGKKLFPKKVNNSPYF